MNDRTRKLAEPSAAAYDRGMLRKLLPTLGLCLILTAGAHAQVQAQVQTQAPTLTGDMAYCADLSDLYRRYLGQSTARNKIPDVTASAAMNECEKGNTAAGIPVLEEKLINSRFTLPKRT